MTDIQETATPLSLMSTAFATVTDRLTVISEAATGYRRTLESQGWSETVAEGLAAQVLMHWTAQFLGGIQ